MNQSRIPTFVYAAIVLTAVLSLASIFRRHQVETENRAVSLAAEYDAVETLAASQGLTIDQALGDLKAQGLNALVLNEESIGELPSQGKATLVAIPGLESGSGVIALRFTEPAVIPRVQQGLRIRFGELAGRLAMRDDAMIMPPVGVGLIRTTPIGLDPQQVAAARRAGMQIIARHANTAGSSGRSIRETLAWSHGMGATVFLPLGDQVLGRRDALDDTVEALRSLGMHYASPEFAKIGGDQEMVEADPGNVIRLHTAQSGELDRLTVADAVDRFAKAARERNMRILLLRPISLAASQPLAEFDDFVKQVAQEVVREGDLLGTPHPFREPGVPKPLFLLIGAAIAPVVWFAVARFVSSPRVRLVGAVLIGLLAVACLAKTGAQLMALLGSMAFPVVAFYALDEMLPGWRGPSWARVLLGFLVVTAISLVGGLCVAGLLNGLPYYVKASEFKAIRVAMFLPILVVGAHYALRLTDWRAGLRSPILWGTAGLSIVIAGILGVMISRSGNDSSVGASGGELIIRSLLDRFLYVRPRSKEFLFGHPALMVAIGMLGILASRSEDAPPLPNRDRFAGVTVLLLMLGAVGQTDVVNTLCHLHIPVMLSLARIGLGTVLGCIIGLGVWAVVGRMLPGKEA